MNAKYDLLKAMELNEVAILFIGLIFGILLIMFIIVAVLLIYSLLLISVETKTFDIGVMRMVGLSKIGFVTMIFTQAGFFVLPAVIAGFLFAFPCIWMTYSYLFTSDLGFQPTIYPSTGACIQALALGLLIPILSSILPIKRALGTNLNEALNVQRDKNKNTLITFTDSKKVNVAPYILFGSISVMFGLSIYLLLPYSIISMNY